MNRTKKDLVTSLSDPLAAASPRMPSTVCFTVDSRNRFDCLQTEARAFLRNFAAAADGPRLPDWLAQALDKFRADRLLSASFLTRAAFRGSPVSCKVELTQKTSDRTDGETLVRLTALREEDTGEPCAQADGASITPELCRMESLKVAGELAAGVSHEIRNPMTSVRGFLQMLSDKEDLAEYRPYFVLMIGELDRANSIITEYLSLAKNKLQPAQPINLCDVVRKLQPLLEASALMNKKSLRLSLEPVPDLPLSDKEICQLLINLAKNGFEAMEAGKTLTIGTRVSADGAALFVADEGHGIPAPLLEKIGEPFFTTKENGTGLGLPICYALARHNHAEIQVASSEAGTTFTVRFRPPLETASPGAAQRFAPAPKTVSG